MHVCKLRSPKLAVTSQIVITFYNCELRTGLSKQLLRRILVNQGFLLSDLLCLLVRLDLLLHLLSLHLSVRLLVYFPSLHLLQLRLQFHPANSIKVLHCKKQHCRAEQSLEYDVISI